MIHPARQIQFHTLLSELRERVSQKLISESRDGHLALFTYTKGCQYDKKWDLYTSVARGLILDLESETVVATPFPKFFNFGEQIAHVPDEPFDVYEKLDGSLGIVFFHGGSWRCATKGSFKSDQAAWAEAWLSNHECTKKLVPGKTYLFEIIYPENRIVVRYPFSGMVLLSVYGEDGRESDSGELTEIGKDLGVRVAERYHFSSMDEILSAVDQFKSDREGVVVRFQSGLRMKVKGREYCLIHRAVSAVTPLTIHGLMSVRTDLDAVRREIPEEFTLDFDAIVAALTRLRDDLLDRVESEYRKTERLSDKEVGLSFEKIDPACRGFIFQRRKGGPNWWKSEKSHEAVYRAIRPTGNRLQGYDPSLLLLRLEAES